MNLMSSAPTLYLYSRVSTEKQAAGNKTGVQRQTEGALVEATKAKYSSMPVVHMSDNGMSASKGENIEHGRLGDFIELCRSGQIAPGSVLAMENIDRFSRLALTRASEYLTCVLAANVFVYTWIDGAVYQKIIWHLPFSHLLNLKVVMIIQISFLLELLVLHVLL